MLPSILDSKMWKVRCTRGLERSLVAQLLRKAIDFLNYEKPFMILSVFCCDKTKGTLYIEAHNMAHVLAFIQGMSGVFRRGIEMIPYNQMTQVLKVCSEMSQTALREH